jgi:hypothetical protein
VFFGDGDIYDAELLPSSATRDRNFIVAFQGLDALAYAGPQVIDSTGPMLCRILRMRHPSEIPQARHPNGPQARDRFGIGLETGEVIINPSPDLQNGSGNPLRILKCPWVEENTSSIKPGQQGEDKLPLALPVGRRGEIRNRHFADGAYEAGN